MQKYIFISVIIIANIIGVYLLVHEEKKVTYPEEIVNEITKDANNELNTFLNSVYNEIDKIKNELTPLNSFSKEDLDQYFIQNSGLNSMFYSAFIKKNNLFYVINNENKSLISAFDTLEEVNVVKWSRFIDKKLVTSWSEVVKLDSVSLKWLGVENKKPNNILTWGIGDGNEIEGENILLNSIKWTVNKDEYQLILRYNFGTMSVFDNNIQKYKTKHLLIHTTDNRYIKFTKDTIISFSDKQIEDTTYIFEKEIIDYSKTLNKKTDKIFSFSYYNKLFWTINLDTDNKFGITDYTLTISNDEIIDTKRTKTILIFIYVIFLILSIITVLKILKIIKFRQHKPSYDAQDVLLTLLKEDEGRYLEFKSSLRWDYRQAIVNADLENVVLKTIGAFGNSDGGTLLIGVDDDKNIIGLDKDYTSLKKYGADFYEIYLRNMLHKHMGVKYVTENLRISFHKFDNKEICKVEVFKANEPLYLSLTKKGVVSEKFYVRSGNSSNELKSLKDINDYIFNRFKK